MLDAIRFAAAGVAKKDYVSGLTHFQIKDGRITGFNGRMALSTDLGVDIRATPNAASFLAAVKAAGDNTIVLNLTAVGKLAVRAGKFRAYVNCIDNESATFLEPQGDTVELGKSFLDGIRLIAPVMGVDASREWSAGIKLQSGSMFATNNVVIAQFWHGAQLPFDVVIPASAVTELLRIGQPPTRVQVTANTITFWFGPTRWLLTVLLEGSLWPLDKIENVLNRPGDEVELPKGFFEAVDTLRPFVDDLSRVYVTPTGLCTSLVEGEGASVDVDMPEVPGPQAYNHKQLVILGQVATAVDWTSYPQPCKFKHSSSPMRGVMVGQRL